MDDKHHPSTRTSQATPGRFELAAARMADAWQRAGRVEVTPGDLRIAREFLERLGFVVRDLPGCLVQLVDGNGRGEDMTREALMLVAFRLLARKVQHARATGRVVR